MSTTARRALGAETIGLALAGLFAAAIAIALVVHFALEERRDPLRCLAPLVAHGPRCCAPGQSFEAGVCVGAPSACPEGLDRAGGPVPGCAAEIRRSRIAGGKLTAVAADWEHHADKPPEPEAVKSFEIDRFEVTHERWLLCMATRTCRPIGTAEPGLPVTNVTPEEAEQFCMLGGGRLPTAHEWMLAASGAEGRRFPWGYTGLVCRRAAFGMVEGPCTRGATGPDLAGARPDGVTPDGVHDLAGNVAEWTREPGGGHAARGGSYRSRKAAELKSWAVERMPEERRAPHIGFRCAYDGR